MAFSKPAFSPVSRYPIPLKRIPRIAVKYVLDNETLDKMCNRRLKKLKEAKHALRKAKEDDISLSESLRTIDALQRLGIDYHFQDEIKAVLNSHYKICTASSNNQNLDLSQVALRFRLLRQQGYHVPADVFNKFKNENGVFKQELAVDIKGLLELYEASQLNIGGEYILDEAEVFSGHLLNSSAMHLDDHLAGIVANTLKHPHHKTLSRSVIKIFLLNFQCTIQSKETFLELAKLDFNMLQSSHREEIVHISKWWRDIELNRELMFAREKPLEWFAWPMASLTEPSLSGQRVELAKVVSLFHLIQDVFHCCGRIDQLSHFVEAVNRWDIVAANNLPDYMNMCLKALFDITEGIAYKICRDDAYNPKRSLQNAWTRLCNALLGEAKWVAVGQFPRAEEYLKIANSTSGIHVLLLHAFFLLGEGITRETVHLVNNDPDIISSAETILCLCDGIGGAKGEDKKWGLGSYMECYKRQYPGTSVQDAKKHVLNKILDTWKQLNRHCLSPNPFSDSFTKAALNCARLAPLMHSFDDNHTVKLPSLQENMNSLIFESIAV